ncbi:MAG: radical SAM protein [Elusimicrobia bacterium]|nr:radical SAM protein [Elusimicrobiota bacterium]
MTLPRLIESGAVGPARVLEACPGSWQAGKVQDAFAKAVGLLLRSGDRRIRVVLSGSGPGADGALDVLEDAASKAGVKALELDCVLRLGGSGASKTLLERWQALGGRVVLSAERGQEGRLKDVLARLASAGVPGAVELRVAPAEVSGLALRLSALAPLGPVSVRLASAPGRAGADRAMTSLELGLSSWLEAQARARSGNQGLQVANFWEEDEPELLAPDLALTDGGGLAWASAVRHAGLWPEFLQAGPPVLPGGIESLESLFMEPSTRQTWASRLLSGEARDLWRDSAALSLRLWSFFQQPFPGWRDGSENRSVRRGLMAADLAGQDRFLDAHLPGVSSVFLFLRTGCVNDCAFCKAKPQESGQPLAELCSALRTAGQVRRKRIALAGNEPLLHPELAKILRLCRKQGFVEVEVMTSGTLLAEPSRAASLMKAGATSLALPLYAAEPGLHDRLTGRRGSFDEALKSVENARKAGLKVFIHTNLMRQNLGALAGLEDLAARQWGLPFVILPLRPKAPESMNLPYEELEPSYRELLDAGLKVASLTGFPVCVSCRIQGPAVPGPEQMADSVKLYLLHQTFVKPVSCLKCPETRRCLGTFREHLEAHPEDLPLLKL